MLQKLILLILTFFITSCNSENEIVSNFYHWKQELNIDKDQKNFLSQNGSKKLYVKFFDVDFIGGKPVPISKLNWVNAPSTIEIVPCVFIKNRVFKKHLKTNELKILCQNIGQLIDELYRNTTKYQEVQFDCDWSLMTKEAYFSFLKFMKSELKNKTISATIRLHQIKYLNKTGVPPVDKGVLMFYNMGNINDVNEKNSILNLEISKRYLSKLCDYPLKLDVALPCFEWLLLIRNNSVIKIINNIDQTCFKSAELSSIGDNKYKVTQKGYYFGNYLYKGDVLKHEFVDYEMLKTASQLLNNELKNENREIIYYQLNKHTLNKFSDEQIKNISDSFI